MISLQITDTDAFLDMPATSQLLYFHLTIRADDEGFVSNPKKISRLIGIQSDDLKVLIAKRFVLEFESGVVVIKHWLIHNTIRMDRFNKTVYQEEKNSLTLKENKAYTELATKGQPVGNQRTTQVKLSKVKLSKVKTETIKSEVCTQEGKEIIELTELLYSKVKENYSFLVDKKTDIQWQADFKEMGKINRIDGRELKVIRFIILWSQQDPFWKQNIRSVKKLRKQFDTLMVRAKGQVDERGIKDYDN